MDVQEMFTLGCEFVERAKLYVEAYPNVADENIREAIFWTHLAYLINNSFDNRLASLWWRQS